MITSAATYPSDRQGCGFAVRYLKWLTGSGVAMEIGPEGVAIVTAIVTQEDEIHYARHVNFHNAQLAARCGIVSEHSLIRARQRAIDAGVLHYEQGAKRKPGRYWVTGYTAESAANPQLSGIGRGEYTAHRAGNPQPSRSESVKYTAESAAKAAPSIPNTLIHPIPIEKSARFQPPKLEEVQLYLLELGYSGPVKPEAIFDYYEANGWRVGKSPMKCWRAAVRGWLRRESEFGKSLRSDQASRSQPSSLPVKLPRRPAS